MEELEKYECFGIPNHVWIEHDGTVAPPAPGANRRNWVYREAAALGAEAMPSLPVDFAPN